MGPKTIKSAINDARVNNTNVVRLQYIPYTESVAKHIWFGIAKDIIGTKINKTPGIVDAWTNLIKYAHGDESCKYNTSKSICIMGRTGSGKSATMQILSDYTREDNVQFIRNGKRISFNYRIFSARQIVSDFSESGYDGIQKYMIYSNICIDDLGSEPKEALYYGTRLNVLSEIIEERYAKGLTTHFTTNFDEDLIQKNYDDRVYSRMVQQCNMIYLSDKDFRQDNKNLFS